MSLLGKGSWAGTGGPRKGELGSVRVDKACVTPCLHMGDAIPEPTVPDAPCPSIALGAGRCGHLPVLLGKLQGRGSGEARPPARGCCWQSPATTAGPSSFTLLH